jgi:hypothetical protein
MSFERATAFFSFPEMREMKEGRYSQDVWRRMVLSMNEVSGFTGEPGLAAKLPAWRVDAQAAALGTLMYPQAKAYLLARGMTREAVEAMPVYETLERYFVLSYEEATDDIFKWMALPVADAWKGMEQAERDFGHAVQTGQTNLLARIFLPSVGKVALLAGRLDRQIDALQIVESIRMHAAETGAFPSRLADLKLPVPRDPLTGEAFQYELSNGKALLSAPPVPSTDKWHQAWVRMEITMRK